MNKLGLCWLVSSLDLYTDCIQGSLVWFLMTDRFTRLVLGQGVQSDTEPNVLNSLGRTFVIVLIPECCTFMHIMKRAVTHHIIMTQFGVFLCNVLTSPPFAFATAVALVWLVGFCVLGNGLQHDSFICAGCHSGNT